MGLSITLASGKGGTGKTTITANLGVTLAQFGRDVIILDADIEMGNLELIFGFEKSKITLHHALSGEASIMDAIYEGPEGVKIIPAGLSLETLKKVDPDKLEGILEELLEDTEILLLDAPAGLGKSAITALSAADELIVVANPDVSSMSDALKTKIVARKLGAHVLGTVLNRASPKAIDLTVPEVEIMLETKVLALIPEDPEIRKSLALGQPLVIRAPDSPAALAIKKLAADLVGEEYATPKSTEKQPKKGFISGLFGRK